MGIKRKSEVSQPESLSLEPNKQNEFTKQVKKIQSEHKGGIKPGRGVIYLGHIPHGFYETEMQSYFSQFGDVTRLKLSRSRKTGRSRGYAFIEFADAEVAQIAAESMNNYLMFEKLLKCEVVPPEKVHPNTFICGSLSARINPKHYVKAIKRHNSFKSEIKQQKLVKKTIRKQKLKLAKLAELGIKLDLNSILKTDDTIEKVDVDIIKEKKKAKQIIPEKIETPKGELMVLAEDESETEITFKTPPNSVRSSKLTSTGKRKKSDSDTPRSRKSEKMKQVRAMEAVELKLEASPTDDDLSAAATIVKAEVEEKTADKNEKKNESCKTPRPGSSKKPKKESTSPHTPESKPTRMTTRSSARKSILSSQTKLKTPPSGRKRL